MFETIRQRILLLIKHYSQYVDITTIIHLIIYFFVLYIIPSGSLFMGIMLIDGLVDAARYIKMLHEGNDDIYTKHKMHKSIETDIITRTLQTKVTEKLPQHAHRFCFTNEGTVSTVEKMFLFGVAQVVSWLINVMLWSNMISLFNAILMLVAIPGVHILFLNTVLFTRVFASAIVAFKSITSFILSKLTANIINRLSETCLGHKPKIDYNEIIDFYEDYDLLISNIFAFLRTVTVQTIMYYLKTSDNLRYSWLVSLVHRWQVENLVPFNKTDPAMTYEKKQKLLIDIVKNRKWDEFLKTKTVNLFFEQYDNKENDFFFKRIGILWRNIRINLLRFISVWSISVVSPLISIALDSYYAFFNNRFYMEQHIASYVVASVILYFGNPIVGSLLLVLSPLLVKPVIEYLDEHKIISNYVIRSQEQLKYLIIIPLISKLGFVSFLIPLFLYYVNTQVVINAGMVGIIVISALSDFTFAHVFCVWIAGTICYNIYLGVDYKPPTIEIDMFADYIAGKQNNNNRLLQVKTTPVKVSEGKSLKLLNPPKQSTALVIVGAVAKEIEIEGRDSVCSRLTSRWW